MTLKAIEPGMLALVTTDEWFFAPDGQEYRGAFGPCHIVKAEDLMGFRPKNSADWFLQVGYGDKAVLLAGCRVHYAAMATAMPKVRAIYDATGRATTLM